MKKTARPVHPNAGVRSRYQRDLDKLMDEMHHSIMYWVEAAYKANPPEIAMDALPSQVLAKRLDELGKRWVKRFDDMAQKIAERFVESGKKATDRAMMQSFKDAGWTVEFKPTRYMKDAMNASVIENVKLITNIPRHQMLEINGIVMRGYTGGRDLKYISDELQKRYGINKRRAALISRDQAAKLNSTVTRARREELGLFEAEWIHSKGGKHPRPEHVKAGNDRLRYDIRKGAYIGGKFIHPGEEINCRCVSRTILPF